MMFKKSQKDTRPTSDDCGFVRVDRTPVRHCDLSEALQGRKPTDPVHNAEGIALKLEATLGRYGVDRFSVRIRLGHRWYELTDVQADDPALVALRERFTVFDPSPSQIEAQQQYEAAQQEIADRAAAYQRQRQEVALSRQREQEAHRLRAAEGRP